MLPLMGSSPFSPLRIECNGHTMNPPVRADTGEGIGRKSLLALGALNQGRRLGFHVHYARGALAGRR